MTIKFFTFIFFYIEKDIFCLKTQCGKMQFILLGVHAFSVAGYLKQRNEIITCIQIYIGLVDVIL